MSNTFDKLSILDSFIEEVNSYLPQIETNLERLTQSPADMDALEETSRFTHTIGGAASMMDFPGLAHVAHGMEDILGDALDGLTVLDDATLGLLKRSLGRLHQLLAGVHSGIDEEAVIAEDDNDYARYRAMIEPMLNAQQTGTHEGLVNGGNEGYAPVSDSYVAGQLPASSAYDSSLPSFDEVLASFRTPVVLPDEEVAWPEEPLPTSQFGMGASPQLQETYLPQGGFDREFGSGQPAGVSDQPSSALDALVASTRQPTSALPAVGMTSPYILEKQETQETSEETAQPMWAADYPATSEISAENR
ncbi:MAG TPA: Hpt domain-containing protein, partial [Ktedonobacteraceae bacterium]